MNREKKFYALAGAVTLASAALITDFMIRTKKRQVVGVALLVAGIAGLVGGVALACQPAKETMKKLAIGNIFDDGDADLLNENIAELFDGSEEE